MMQVVDMSDQEKYDMYMEIDRPTLIKMLIECNNQLQIVCNSSNPVTSKQVITYTNRNKTRGNL